MDYGTFGLWAGLLAGGQIVLPKGYQFISLCFDLQQHIIPGFAFMKSPDTMLWEKANLENVEYIDVSQLNVTVNK